MRKPPYPLRAQPIQILINGPKTVPKNYEQAEVRELDSIKSEGRKGASRVKCQNPVSNGNKVPEAPTKKHVN